MKLPFIPILRWIGTTLLTAVVEQAAERLIQTRQRQTQSAPIASGEKP